MENIVLQVGVKVLLKNSEGKYLMIRRSLEKYHEVTETRWDIVGGRINPGQPLMQNLAREVKEETDLELVGQPRLIAAQDILRVPDRHIVRLTYVGECKGEVVLDTSENDAHQWLGFDELIKLEGVDIYFKELLNQNLIN